MIYVYNFLQITLLIITFPILILYIISKKKYRSRIAQRLGFGLKKKFGNRPDQNKKTIWIHALSVGEVTSALPLIKGLRNEMNDIEIIFSATTTTGMAIAKKNISPFVDQVISAPVDLLLTVKHFIHSIQPDIFILVETDFWPNWITQIKSKNIPIMLVNGRISKKSFDTYKRFSFFFAPLFKSFTLLSMQTEHDAGQIKKLGIPAEKITTLGNLKYDTAKWTENSKEVIKKTDLHITPDSLIWICGSTHPGEEEILLKAFSKLKETHNKLILIIAPRDPGRGLEIADIAYSMHLKTTLRTSGHVPEESSILILNTIGELTQCYTLAKIAFIGGSLVQCGGHNPLEAASCGVPVLFGRHMEDFQEIADDCIRYNAGIRVQCAEEIASTVGKLLNDSSLYSKMSNSAKQLIHERSGVVSRHIAHIQQLLDASSPD